MEEKARKRAGDFRISCVWCLHGSLTVEISEVYNYVSWNDFVFQLFLVRVSYFSQKVAILKFLWLNICYTGLEKPTCPLCHDKWIFWQVKQKKSKTSKCIFLTFNISSVIRTSKYFEIFSSSAFNCFVESGGYKHKSKICS